MWMTTMSDILVRERIAVYAAMGGLGCGGVRMAKPFAVLHAQSIYYLFCWLL